MIKVWSMNIKIIGSRYEFKILFGGKNELTEPLKINKLFL